MMLLMIYICPTIPTSVANNLQIGKIDTWVRIINTLSARGLLTDHDFQRFSKYNHIKQDFSKAVYAQRWNCCKYLAFFYEIVVNAIK